MTQLAFFITARMGSTRLPDKHFQDLNGKPVLSHLIERVEAAAAEDDLVVITTGRDAANRAFEGFSKPAKRCVFYGDDLHIPRRHSEAASHLGVDLIVAVDGDDPLTSVEAMKDVARILRQGVALGKTAGLPIGMNSWGYSAKLLASVLESCQKSQLDTGWGSIFDGHEARLLDHTLPDAGLVRMTLDYQEDLEFFRRVLDDCPAEICENDAELLRWILRHEFHGINGKLNETYWKHFHSNK